LNRSKELYKDQTQRRAINTYLNTHAFSHKLNYLWLFR
jgi:hypothetical protein